MVFRAQKIPDLAENNTDRSEADPFQIRESLIMKDREVRTSSDFFPSHAHVLLVFAYEELLPDTP